MGKGELTRQSVLERATALASQYGLAGLTIGTLASELELSKSGLFAHFGSKQALQVQVIEFAAARFIELVVRPALGAPRGEPRLRALFERWLEWDRSSMPGGCVFVAAASELDDQPGPARDALVRNQREWLELLANCFRMGKDAGQFEKRADPAQFAQDLFGVMLAGHHAHRLLKDPLAGKRARRAFDALLRAAKKG